MTDRTGKRADLRMGMFLKRQREMLGMSQSDVASKIGFPNMGFISMLENGVSKIPPKRIPDIVKAYHLNKIYVAVIIRQVYPDLWTLFKETLMAASDYIVRTKADDALDKLFAGDLKGFSMK